MAELMNAEQMLIELNELGDRNDYERASLAGSSEHGGLETTAERSLGLGGALVSFLLSDHQEDTVSFPTTANAWFASINDRPMPTGYTGGEWVSPRHGGEHGGETGAQPPPPTRQPTRPWGRPEPELAPCQHERTVEQLRAWLSGQPFDGRVQVGDVLMRLGRAPRAGA